MLLLKVSKEEEIANDLLAESNISKVIKSNWIDKQDNFLLKNILKKVTHLALIQPLYHFLQYPPASGPNLTREERNQHLPPAYIELKKSIRSF